MIYVIFLILLFILFYVSNFISNTKETFINSKYQNQRLPYKDKVKLKEDVYMNFLGKLNDSFNIYLKEINTNSTIPQTVLCNDVIRKKVQTKALTDAFKTLNEKDTPELSKDSQITFVVNDNRTCANKSSYLCEFTNPILYLNDNVNFPPRWIGPYKNTPLPKHTNLNCWNDIFNCCKTNFN